MVEVRVRGAKAAHRGHLYIYPLNFAIELNPDMNVDNMTYIFSMDELLSTQKVQVDTVGLAERF